MSRLLYRLSYATLYDGNYSDRVTTGQAGALSVVDDRCSR